MNNNDVMSSRVEVLKDSVPLSGNAFSVVAIIPGKRQSGKLYAFKIYGQSAKLGDAEKIAQSFSAQEPYVDIIIVENGHWAPLDFSPEDIENQKHPDQFLEQLVNGRKAEHERGHLEWERSLAERREAVKRDYTTEGQQALQAAKESCISVLRKINETKPLYAQSKQDLESLFRRYQEDYTAEEKQAAENAIGAE